MPPAKVDTVFSTPMPIPIARAVPLPFASAVIVPLLVTPPRNVVLLSDMPRALAELPCAVARIDPVLRIPLLNGPTHPQMRIPVALAGLPNPPVAIAEATIDPALVTPPR